MRSTRVSASATTGAARQRFSRKTRGSTQISGSHQRRAANQRGRAESRWVADMGVREQVGRRTSDAMTAKPARTPELRPTSVPIEEAPGISPLLVAEVLDHAIFFSLGDLGKALPQYEEIALPVELDADIYAEYDRTRQRLKDYLIQRRWEGDTTFRGRVPAMVDGLAQRAVPSL